MIAIVLILIFILACYTESWNIALPLLPFMIGVVLLFFLVFIPTLRDNLRK